MLLCNQSKTNDVPYLRNLGIMGKFSYLDLFQITNDLSMLVFGLHKILQINIHKQIEITFDMLNVFSLF